MLDGIFRNNGYRTVLGSGQNDGGVDLRLYSNDVVGEILTLVQAKRYAPHRPIELEAVKALGATVEDEKANRGLFVTTSRFSPAVKTFAHRQNQRLILGTSSDIQEWAQQASQRILRDKSNLVSPSSLQIILEGKNNIGLEGKIFHAYTHAYIYNSIFTLVLKESKGAVLLLALPEKILTGDFQRGTHVPEVNLQPSHLTNAYIFRAKKKMNERGELYLWGSQKLFTLWDGTPKYFDRMD